MRGEPQQWAHVAGVEVDVGDVVERRVLARRDDRLLLDLDRLDLPRPPRQRQAERADAAVEVHAGAQGLGAGEAQRRLVEHLAHAAVGLQEGRRRHPQVDAGEALAQVRFAEEHVRTVADGRVGRRRVDGDGERAAAAGGRHALGKLLLLREAPGREEVQKKIAAGEPFADDEVPQEAVVVLAPERAQPEVAARLGHRLAGTVHARRGEHAVGGFDDVLPRAAAMQTEEQRAVVGLAEGELHLVAVAPGVVHAADRLEFVAFQVAEALQRLDDLLLLELELRLVGEGLPLAAAAFGGVAAHWRDAARGGGEELDHPRLAVRLLAPRDLRQHAVAGYGAAHEEHEIVDARHALSAVGERGDLEFELVPGVRRHGGQCTCCSRLRRTGLRHDCPPCGGGFGCGRRGRTGRRPAAGSQPRPRRSQ